MLFAKNSPVLFSISPSRFPKRGLILITQMLPLERTAYHIPVSDTPRDFEYRGPGGGAGFLMGACIRHCAYLEAGEGPSREDMKCQPRRLCL